MTKLSKTYERRTKAFPADVLKICGTGEKNLSFQHSLHDLEVTKLKKYPYRKRLKLNMDAKVTPFLSKYEYVLLWPHCRALSEPEVRAIPVTSAEARAAGGSFQLSSAPT